MWKHVVAKTVWKQNRIYGNVQVKTCPPKMQSLRHLIARPEVLGARCAIANNTGLGLQFPYRPFGPGILKTFKKSPETTSSPGTPDRPKRVLRCNFFAYNWKIPAHSGSSSVRGGFVVLSWICISYWVSSTRLKECHGSTKRSTQNKTLNIILWGPKKSSIAKRHPKPSQELSEQFAPSLHKMKCFSRNSRQKVHPNFAQTWEDKFLGIPFLVSNTWILLKKPSLPTNILS